MLKKSAFLGIAVGCIILVGCNSDISENHDQEEIEVSERALNEEVKDSGYLTELQNELKSSIAQQVGLEIDSIMLDSSLVNGVKEVTCAIGLPEEAKIEDKTVQQIIEITIKNVTKTENVSISEDDIEITKGDKVLKKFK